jgi:protease I
MAKKILLLIEDLFEDSEAIYPYYRFIEEGYKVEIIGPKANAEYRSKHGLVLKSDHSPTGISLKDVAAIIIPGGYAPDRMRRDKGMVDLVKKAHNLCRVVAAICHGGWMLIEANIIKNRKVTGVKAISTDLKNAGGNYLDKEVVVDDNIITSRSPKDLPAFCKTIIEVIKIYFK